MSTAQNCLIDNATLSGVQRLLGSTQTQNLSNIDNDICCFEKLVNAILFGNELYALDDYKPELRENRHRTFSYIRFIAKNEVPYDQLSLEPGEFAKGLAFAFEGSKPIGDALAFFETIKVNPQLRWNIFTSSEYLTLSYLVHDKQWSHEAAVSAAFGNELYDRDKSSGSAARPALEIATGSTTRPVDDIKALVHEYTKTNPNYAGRASRDTLEKVVFGYGWVAERSYLYNGISDFLGISCALSPLRDAFCETNYRLDHSNELDTIVRAVGEEGQQSLACILGATGEAKFALKLPFFTAYLLSKCSNVREAIEAAFELRKRSDITGCRELLSNLQHLERRDLVKEANSILRYLREESQSLLEEYCVDVGQGPAFGISMGLTGPSVEATTHLRRLFRDHRNRPFGKVFRSMARDMLNAERLGALHEKATVLVREHKDARHSIPATVPDYMEGRTNEYGRPALPND